jgi:hypothetical protein
MPSTRTHHLPSSPPHRRFARHARNRATNARFRVFGLNPTPGFALANAQPPWRLHAIHPHLPSPVIAPHRRFTWHARNRATNARFRVFGLNPTPGLALANAQPPRHLHAIHPHPQPPIIVPPLHFMAHGRNRAMNAQFRVFGPNPAHCPRIGKRAAPPPSPCHPPAPTTSRHRLTPSFHTAHPKPSHPSRFSGVLTPTPPSRTHAASPPPPPCPQHPSTSPHCPPWPFALILSRCTQFSGFCSVYIIFCNLLHNNDNNTLSDKCGNEFNNYIRFLH